MTSAANDESYGDLRWTSGPYRRGRYSYYGGGGWHGWTWEPVAVPPFLIGIPKPVFVLLMVLGFIFWWPIGLILLGVMLWRKVAMCGGYRQDSWQQGSWQQRGAGDSRGWKTWCGAMRNPPSSGNRAFDEYRTETLERLEREQKEFEAFLERLRFAKDKAEFDQFMNERRNRPPETPPETPQGQPSA